MSQNNIEKSDISVNNLSIKVKTIDSNEFKIDIDKNSLISDLKKSVELVNINFIFHDRFQKCLYLSRGLFLEVVY